MATGYGTPGWYIYSVVGQPLKADYATSPADFRHRYGVPPMPGQWYPTQARAQSAISNNFAPPGSLQARLSSPLSGIAEVGAIAKAAFLAVTDASMWRSVGVILLGVFLIFAGLRLWLGKPLLPKAPAVVPVPV